MTINLDEIAVIENILKERECEFFRGVFDSMTVDRFLEELERRYTTFKFELMTFTDASVYSVLIDGYTEAEFFIIAGESGTAEEHATNVTYDFIGGSTYVNPTIAELLEVFDGIYYKGLAWV